MHIVRDAYHYPLWVWYRFEGRIKRLYPRIMQFARRSTRKFLAYSSRYDLTAHEEDMQTALCRCQSSIYSLEGSREDWSFKSQFVPRIFNPENWPSESAMFISNLVLFFMRIMKT